MEALNKYLEATQHHLGVEGERYGGGFRAIVAPRPATEFLFGMLEGDDIEGTEAQFFLSENPLFPSAYGSTPQEALQKLNVKLSLLYHFVEASGAYKWSAEPLFELKAQYDSDPGEEPGTYQVSWGDVVQDLQSDSDYFYEHEKQKCNRTVNRDLHALVNFNYDGPFALLKKM